MSIVRGYGVKVAFQNDFRLPHLTPFEKTWFAQKNTKSQQVLAQLVWSTKYCLHAGTFMSAKLEDVLTTVSLCTGGTNKKILKLPSVVPFTGMQQPFSDLAAVCHSRPRDGQ